MGDNLVMPRAITSSATSATIWAASGSRPTRGAGSGARIRKLAWPTRWIPPTPTYASTGDSWRSTCRLPGADVVAGFTVLHAARVSLPIGYLDGHSAALEGV